LYSKDILLISGCPKVQLWALEGTELFLEAGFFLWVFLTGLKNVEDYLY